ncbi:MAG: nucleoside-triphosphatase [Prolixibacteraceae bacterium]
MELIRHNPLNEVWLKAAVVGSLWASVEVVAGSFLHNLQIPLSGTILTAFAVFLLAAFSRLWKDRGIIWRAGVICALMKSISPSAIIIGPMVGIITEAFLFELVLLVMGRNILGTLAGGALAAVTAIFHKFFTLLILYGFDFVRILDQLYQFAVKQLNISNIKPLHLIGLLVAMYLIVGFVAALLGVAAGNSFLKKESQSESIIPLKIRNENLLFGMSAKQDYAAVLLLIHLLVLTTVLGLLNLNYFISSGVIALIYTGFCIYRYPTAHRQLKKISVWFQFLLLVLVSVLIWDVFNIQISGGESGWLTGLKMIFRAILLIIGFAAISVELKNPLVKTVLYKRGFSNLYQSLTLAFGVLPDLVSSLSSSKLNILNPATVVNHLLQSSKSLIELFENEQNNLPVIFIVTGEVGSGKTTFADQLVRLLQSAGLRTGGFLSAGTANDSERTGFRLIDIYTSKSIVMCEITHHEGWIQMGRYYFNPEAFEFGNSILNPLNLQGNQLVVVDEIGPLEMKNQGWSRAIDRLISKRSVSQLWIVRRSLLPKIVRKWNVGDVYVFDVVVDSVADAERSILARLG